MANFDKMTEDGRRLFLGYDQEHMIAKYGIPADEDYLYAWLLCRMYRIGRADGRVEVYGEPVPLSVWTQMRDAGTAGGAALPGNDWGSAWLSADNGVAMTWYDVLCYGKDDAAAAGEFINLDSLVTLISAGGNPGGGMMSKYTKPFDAHPEELEQVLIALGGVPQGKADVSYEMPLFDFMNVRLQLWHADEDFPAMVQIYVDKGILGYMHYETVWYLMMHYIVLIDREMKRRLQPADASRESGAGAGTQPGERARSDADNFYSWS